MTQLIKGNPTKSFFIEMISRDIKITDAILDLLDNSIDGANNINASSFNDFKIEITVNQDEFIISDNCGGFSLELAKNYAFRFGRPDDSPKTNNSIGRFGIGMKRALFKLGKNFIVETKTDSDHFIVDVDVEDWKNKKRTISNSNGDEEEMDDWNFTYTEKSDDSFLTSNGTYIRVNNLDSEVSKLFGEEIFLTDLRSSIERMLNLSLEKGLKVILNGVELNKIDIFLLNDNTKPYYKEFSLNNVDVKLFAGLSRIGYPKESGWYIYCNDRLVLKDEHDTVTGWGTPSIPRWHPDYVMFKGVIFMNSKETLNLPLTTTKKGIDATSEVYRHTFNFMREAMMEVFNFLRKIPQLGDEANDYRKQLNEQHYEKLNVQQLKEFNLSSLEPKTRSFAAPPLNQELISIKKEKVRIAFDAKKRLADSAKIHTNTKSYKELGEYAFNFFLKTENLKNE